MTEPAALSSLAIVVPAFNEASTIESTLARLDACVDALAARVRASVVVVDDGSGDATGRLADAWAAGRPGRAAVLRHSVNRGLGAALRTAFAHSDADRLVVMDCDLSYAPDHVEHLLDAIEATSAAIVIASPYMPGGRTSGVPVVRNVASRVANRLLGAVAPGRLRTLTGMVRAYDGRWLRTLDLTADDPGINTEILFAALAQRQRVVEIPAHLDWRGLPPERRAGRADFVGLTRATLRSLAEARRLYRAAR